MYGLYLPGYQDVIDIPVCRIDRIQDVDQGAGATGTHRGRRVAKPSRRSHTFSSHCVLSHLFGIWFRKRYLHRFESGVGIIYGLGVLLDFVCLLIVNVWMGFVVLIVRAPCFSRVPEIRASLASNYAGICVVRTSINILPSMFLLAILRQR